MIAALSIEKFFGYRKRRANVLRGCSFQIPTGSSMVIYGLPRSGKSTLLAILCGLSTPNRGRVVRSGLISLPVGSPVGLSLGNTAGRICYALAKLHGLRRSSLVEFVESFSEFHGLMDKDISVLSPPDKARLSYGLGYGVPADVYLVDEWPYRGQGAFALKCKMAVDRCVQDASVICATSTLKPDVIRGAAGAVLHKGRVSMFETVGEAAEVFALLQAELSANRADFISGLMSSGRYDEARGLLEQLIDDDPGDLAAVELLSRILLREGDFQRAADLSGQVTKIANASRSVLLINAQAAEQMGDVEGALRSGSAFLEVDPTHRQAGAIVARCLEAKEDYVAAADVWLNIAADGVNREVYAAIRCFERAERWQDILNVVDGRCKSELQKQGLAKAYIRSALALNKDGLASSFIQRFAEVDFGGALALLSGVRDRMGVNAVSSLIHSLNDLGSIAATSPREHTILRSYLVRESSKARSKGEAVPKALELALELLK